MSNPFQQYIINGLNQMDNYDKNAIALRGKNVGCSVKLRGRVVLIAFLVDDAESKWTPSAVRSFIECFHEISGYLMDKSGLSAQELTVACATSPAKVPYTMTRQNHARVVKDVLACYGFTTIEAYQRYYEKNYPCTDCCVSFVFNKKFRSYAAHVVAQDTPVATPYPHGDEYSVVAFYPERREYSKNVLMHEIMHQFGAIDFYFPETVKAAAERLFPQSVMLSGNQIDSLTRYIIGWDSKPDPLAVAFLRAISHLTDEDFARAKQAEWAKTKK